MTAFDGLRETWEAAPPRPWLLVVRRGAAIVLGIIVGAEFALFLYVVIP
jgi:hypothetical protein